MKKAILLIIILLCLIPVFTQAEEELNQEEILLSILDTMGGEFIEGEISANGLLFEEFLPEELENIGQDVIKSIGLVGTKRDINSGLINKDYYVKECIEDENYRQINYFGFDKSGNPLTIILSSYLNESNIEGSTYLYINLINREHFLEINDIIVTIKNIFAEYKTKADITTCIIGASNGKFIEKHIEEKTINAINKVKGKIVDVYRDENLISYTAYTDYIEKNILAGEDRINLNVALRYNEFDDQTLMWIGTPIITGGY